MTIGERIKYLRKDLLDLTMDEFGGRVGITKSSISTMESGKSNPSDQTVRFICREFNVNEEWLLTGEGEVFRAKSPSDEIAAFVKELSTDNESFKAQLVTMLSRMSSDEWDLLEKMIRRLANLDEVAPVQQDSVINAEEEYIKSSSENVPPTEPAASKSIAGEGKGETA